MKYILSLLLLLTTSMMAEENSSPVKPSKDEPKTLQKARGLVIEEIEIRDLSLQDALQVLSQKAREADSPSSDETNKGLNIVESGIPSDARLTCTFSKIPLDQAISYFAALSSRKVIFENDVVKLVPQGD